MVRIIKILVALTVVVATILVIYNRKAEQEVMDSLNNNCE